MPHPHFASQYDTTSNWFIHFGASHHVMSSLYNASPHFEYDSYENFMNFGDDTTFYHIERKNSKC